MCVPNATLDSVVVCAQARMWCVVIGLCAHMQTPNEHVVFKTYRSTLDPWWWGERASTRVVPTTKPTTRNPQKPRPPPIVRRIKDLTRRMGHSRQTPAHGFQTLRVQQVRLAIIRGKSATGPIPDGATHPPHPIQCPSSFSSPHLPSIDPWARKCITTPTAPSHSVGQ